LKNSKAIIAVLCALVLIFALAACAQQKAKTESVTQVVTNENGEVVTGSNGEALTEELEAQIVTDKDGKAVTEIVTGTDGKPLTTVKDNKYVNVTQVVTQSKGGKTTASTAKSGTSKATSTTKKGGSKTTTTTTKPTTANPNVARKIKITVLLPTDAGVKDTLTITVNGKEVKKTEVVLDSLAEYTFTTSDKYKGEVVITASLKNHGSATVKTKDAEVRFEIAYEGIPVLIDDED
jgi:hypothetical protein